MKDDGRFHQRRQKMTKPIEGWVEIYGNEPYIFCDGHTKEGEPFARRIHVHLDDPEAFSSARFCPVKLTFTDENEEDKFVRTIKYKHLEIIRNESDIPQPVVEKEIADAIREERKAIWDRVRGSSWSYNAIKKAILGEKK